jgi:CubicO group peptidase (beta-lactamase class C family)
VELAGQAVGQLGTQFCLSVVKDGKLIFDEDYNFGKDRKIETMSAGKTITAALMGTAFSSGLFDLDTPIAKYGVLPAANWNLSGTDWFGKVTARHLLAQNSGRGKCEPGTCFTYDSDRFETSQFN